MRSTEWEKIQKNWRSLTEELYPADIMGSLIQDGTLTVQDKEKISKAGTRHEQMETLLKKLQGKPMEVNAYSALLKAIKEADGQEGYKHIVTALENTKTDSDPQLLTAVDQHAYDNVVREVLLRNYINRPGKTPFTDILRTLQQQAKIPGGFNWKKEYLAKFIKTVFTGGVNFEKDPKRKKNNISYVINVVPIKEEDPALKEEGAVGGRPEQTEKLQDLNDSKDCPADITNNTESIKNIESLGHVELKEYLTNWFTVRNISTNVPEKLEKESITGEVLMSMSEAEIKEVVPDASFGVKRTLFLLINQAKGKKADVQAPMKFETLRKFDSELTYARTYVRGQYVDLGCGSKKKKTDVVKNFHCIDIVSEDIFALDSIGSNAIEFISACLNARQNGTVYFGIDPKSGEVTGVRVTEEMTRDTIETFTDRAFTEEQLKLVREAVRQPVFVPVVESDQTETDKYVVEVDVVPFYNLLDNTVIRTKRKDLAETSKSKTRREGKAGRKYAVFYLSEDYIPQIVKPDELLDFQKKVQEAACQRKKEEALEISRTPENLREKLLNLLTGGRDILEDVIYPFIILSPFDLSSNADLINKNLQFIKHLQAEVIFDFDSRGSVIYNDLQENQGEILRVITLDGLKAAASDKVRTKEILNTDGRVPWVFCNGYEVTSDKEKSPTEWNKQVRTLFVRCLQHYSKSLQEDRILVIVCLFSKQYDTMIEGCEELLTMFPYQWALLADSDEVAEMWKNELIYRKKIEERDIHERCVTGMPWDQINNTISQATEKFEHKGCVVPQSTGNLIVVPDKKLKSWCDVEIVSAADYERSDDNESKRAMERFYKGESVEWLNFSLEDQVLMRSCHSIFVNLVKKALSERGGDDTVTSAVMFHQPGAGGTTSAMHVLWELRKEYRCCVLKRISQETCQQLVEIRKFSNPTPKPLLILVDNEDQEKCYQLKFCLEREGRAACGENKEVFCTIICCIRKVSPPIQLMSNQVVLLQKLSKKEKGWFSRKQEQLEADFKENHENIDPVHLISFNILKSNFNQKHTEEVVKKCVEDIKDGREIILLTYLSLLNAYDPFFRKISVSCFDKVFNVKGVSAYSSNEGISTMLRRSTKWEANLSPAVHVLLNVASQNKNTSPGMRLALRVNHKLIAKALLNQLTQLSKKSESQIMSELINNLIFDQETHDLCCLQDIVGDIMKKRERKQDGSKDQFSPFITQVKHATGGEAALKLMCDFFYKSNDPSIAQQISRFYYSLENWKEAEKFAEIATDVQPSCSFFWDTYGLVYKTQLKNKIDMMKTFSKEEMFSQADAHSFIDLTRKAIHCFRTEQKLSENQQVTYSENNFSGYFGELKTQIMLLKLLEKCEGVENHTSFRKFLTDKDFTPPSLLYLRDDEILFLKDVEENYTQKIRRLDEHYLQVKDFVQFDRAVDWGNYEWDKKTLIELMISFHEFYGESEDETYTKLPEAESHEYRFRLALKLGAYSLNMLLCCDSERETTKKRLSKIYQLMLPCMGTKYCTFNHLLAILNAVTVTIVNGFRFKCRFKDILLWSKQLYESEQPSKSRPYLEPYMFFVMFNFPSEKRKQYQLCSVKELEIAIEKWKTAFENNNPVAAREVISRQRERTLFFLAKQNPVFDIVHCDALPMNGSDDWGNAELQKHLELFEGFVNQGGDQVTMKIQTKEGNMFHLVIQTSYRVKKDLWQKRTHFFIGFSFYGPKAYGIPQDPLRSNCKPDEHLLQRAVYSNSSISTMLHVDTELDEKRKQQKPRREKELDKLLRLWNGFFKETLSDQD